MLSLAVVDPVSFGAVNNGITDELPDGNAHLAWTNLETIFKPTSNAAKNELEQKFNQCALTQDSKNPDEWFAELEQLRLHLRLDFTVEYDDDKMITQILYNTKPKMYETVIALIKRDISRNRASVTLNSIKEDYRQVYQSSVINKTVKGTHEKVLTATEKKKGKFKKVFKGDCRICGKKGHKGDDCWDNEKNKDKRPSFYKAASKRKESANTANDTDKKDDKKVITCSYCNKVGHSIEKCFKKQNDEKKESAGIAEAVLCCYDTITKGKVNKDTFIADTGATSHMKHSKNGMTDLEPYEVEIKVGNNQVMKSKARGTFHGMVIQSDGSTLNVKLTEVLYVPDLWVNLLSLTKAIKNPLIKITSKEEMILLQIGKDEIYFDKVIQNGSGRLLAIDIVPTFTEFSDYSLINIEQLHRHLGHANDQTVRATAAKMGIAVQGLPYVCGDCAISKIKKKKISKETKNQATEKGGRVSIDISSIKAKSYGGAKHWLLIQDEYTKCVWGFFMKEKSELGETVLQWMKSIEKDPGVIVKCFCTDNAGESVKFQEMLINETKYAVKFEFTATDTPQQNG
jgi:hypothetical protein